MIEAAGGAIRIAGIVPVTTQTAHDVDGGIPNAAVAASSVTNFFIVFPSSFWPSPKIGEDERKRGCPSRNRSMTAPRNKKWLSQRLVQNSSSP
jgi:hypothetical protein